MTGGLPELFIAAGGGSILAGAVNALFNRRKIRADVTDVTTTTSERLVKLSSEYAATVDARLLAMTAKFDALQTIVSSQATEASANRLQIVDLAGELERQRTEHMRQLKAKDEHIAQIEARADNLQRQVNRLRATLRAAGIPPDDADDE